jgi:hypothetical protein
LIEQTKGYVSDFVQFMGTKNECQQFVQLFVVKILMIDVVSQANGTKNQSEQNIQQKVADWRQKPV